METIRQIVQAKGGSIWSVTPDQTVYDAIRLMAEKGVGALVVMMGDESYTEAFASRFDVFLTTGSRACEGSVTS